MPTIAPSRSSLQVMPTAPSVNPALFTQVPDPAQGMQMFEQAAKLPLLMEQIKMEKYKQKAEKAKLDLAEQTAKFQQTNFEKFAQREQAAADLSAATAQAQLEAATERLKREQLERNILEQQNRPLDMGTVSGGIVEEAPGALEGEDNLGETEQPLAKVSVNEFANLGDKTIGKLAADTPEAPAAAPSPRYFGTFVTGQDPVAAIRANTPAGGQAGMAAYAEPVFRAAVQQEFSLTGGPKVKDAATVRQIAKAYKPVEATKTYEDDRGIPMVVDTVKIGEDHVGTRGDPRIDLSRLGDAQKEMDKNFGRVLGETKMAARANAFTNLQRLKKAADLLAAAESSPNPLESGIAGQLVSLLPSMKVNTLLQPNKTRAMEAVRAVVQQSLRETLGAQFAAREGEQMMNRSFNPLFEDNANFGLIRDAISSAEVAAREQERAAGYFSANGTLAGFDADFNPGRDTPLADYVDTLSKSSGSKSKPGIDPAVMKKAAEDYYKAQGVLRI